MIARLSEVTPTPTTRGILRWPTEHSRRWLHAFLRRAEGDTNLLALVAIGSAIRPAVASDDLDLLAVCRNRREHREKAPIEVDLRPVELDSLDERLRAGDPLLVWAVRFGRPLFDRERTWADLSRRWRDSLPLPDPAVADRRAAAARRTMEVLREIGDEDAFRENHLTWLTHRARARLIRAGLHPRSRPELPAQLREIGDAALSETLDAALQQRLTASIGTGPSGNAP